MAHWKGSDGGSVTSQGRVAAVVRRPLESSGRFAFHPQYPSERSMNEPILVLTTGGTIDKQYFDQLSQYQIGETIIRALLESARVAHPYAVEEFLRKDSLDLTDCDRARVRERVTRATASRILITHGTDTMTLTAGALITQVGKTIVLTGALSRPGSLKATRRSTWVWPLRLHSSLLLAYISL